MNLVDWLTGFGIIGIILLGIILIFIPAIAAFIVATLVANYFVLSGIYWWAVVIVLFFVIMGIMGRVSS